VGMAVDGLSVGLPVLWSFSQFHHPHPQESGGGNAGKPDSNVPSHGTPSGNSKASPQQENGHKPHDWDGPEAWLVYITAPLALFTGLLYLSTRRLAADSKQGIRAAKASADAAKIAADASARHVQSMISAETGILDLVQLLLVDAKGATIAPGTPAKGTTVKLQVHNSGRTRLLIKELRLNHCVSAEPPTEPAYAITIGIATVIMPNNSIAFDVPEFKFSLTSQNVADIAAKTSKLWCWGSIRFQNFIDESFTSGWSAHWEMHSFAGTTMAPRGFILQGPPAYNYQHKNE
jgi:hypothetical protein